MKGRPHGLAASPLRITKKAAAPAARVSKVDERLLQTARQIAALADTHAEQEMVEEAARLAGREGDRDFATAAREAATVAPPASGPLHDSAIVNWAPSWTRAPHQSIKLLGSQVSRNRNLTIPSSTHNRVSLPWVRPKCAGHSLACKLSR